MLKKLEFTDNNIAKYLQIVKKEYRLLDPGSYLYIELLKTKDINKKFTKKYIELIYVTLSAWNMNSRGAQLEDFNIFLKKLEQNKKTIIKLSNYHINKITDKEADDVFVILSDLYKNMKLTKTKTNIVTFSKTLHFLLPNLIVPMDRKYTLSYFYNSINLNQPWENEFNKYYFPIFKECISFAKNKDLKKYVDKNINQTIPKIIDNIIIGYEKQKKKDNKCKNY